MILEVQEKSYPNIYLILAFMAINLILMHKLIHFLLAKIESRPFLDIWNPLKSKIIRRLFSEMLKVAFLILPKMTFLFFGFLSFFF